MKHKRIIDSMSIGSRQDGMVSFLVTMIMLIVMTMVVIGFTQQTNQNRRQALDRQLSNQAFYAAETGVNDAYSMIANNPSLVSKTSCDNSGFSPLQENHILSEDGSVAYTCVTFNTTPYSYETGLGAGSGKVIPLEGANPIQSIKISWRAAGSSSQSSTCNASGFPASSSWGCKHGVLRLDGVGDNGDFSRARLMRDTFSLTLSPNSSGSGSINVADGSNNILGGAAAQAVRGNVGCNDTECSVVLNLGALAARRFYLHGKVLYRSAEIRAEIFDSVNSPMKILNSQLEIDSTGKSQDVYRRISVRLPYGPPENNPAGGDRIPDNAIQTNQSLCKTGWSFPGQVSPVDCD